TRDHAHLHRQQRTVTGKPTTEPKNSTCRNRPAAGPDVIPGKLPKPVRAENLVHILRPGGIR
ncbi:MAG: hypothetical protein ACLP5E_04425, partial [Streptosporangiaceae bacterium]